MRVEGNIQISQQTNKCIVNYLKVIQSKEGRKRRNAEKRGKQKEIKGEKRWEKVGKGGKVEG